jgi:O-antigen/teichoic acid export membrane protein
VKAAMQTGLGGVASRILGGLAPLILARYLGPGQYGIYTLILSLVGIVAVAAHLGQNAALQKFLPEYFVTDPARGGAILADTMVLVAGVLAVVCTAFYFLSDCMASAVYHQASLAPVFRFAVLLVLFLSLFNLASSAVAGLQDFASYGKAMVIRSAGFLLLAWAGVAAFGLYGALGGQLLAAALALAFLAIAGVRATRRRFSGMVKTAFSRGVLAEVFSFAFPAFLSGALVAPAYWWANTLLVRDTGFVQVGLFGVAFALAQLILVIPSSVSIPAVSFLSEVHASAESGGFRRLVGTNVRLIWTLTLPVSLACALFSPWIVRVAFGTPYRAATPLVPLMSFAALLMMLNSVIGNAIAGAGRMWHGLAINASWLCLFVITGVFLVPRWGAEGLAIAFVASYFALSTGLYGYSRIVLDVRYEKPGLLAALTLAALLVGSGVFASRADALSAIASALLLLALCAAEWKWALEERERSFVRSMLAWD